MARNEEKQLGRLNRLWLEQLDEECLKKNPPRPGLGSLHTAAEVKKWLPSIKREIDFYLKQSQVTCYPERQIAEFSTKIEQLTREYKACVRKIRELDPGITAVPWTDRAYSRKRKSQEDLEQLDAAFSAGVKENNHQEVTLIQTPILEKEDVYTDLYGHEDPAIIIYNSDPDRENSPLDFRVNSENTPLDFRVNNHCKQDSPGYIINCSCAETENAYESNTVIYKNSQHSKVQEVGKCSSASHTSRHTDVINEAIKFTDRDSKSTKPLVSLNLPYSDSSDEDS